MPQCSAWNCSNRSDRIGPRGKVAVPGKTYHKFPKNAERRSVWVTALQREDFEPSNYSVLCADHFEESCFDRTGQTTRLRENAIPTIFDFSPMQKKTVKPRKPALNRKASLPDRSAPPDTSTTEAPSVNATRTTRSGSSRNRVRLEDRSSAPDSDSTVAPAVRDGAPGGDRSSQAAGPSPGLHSEDLSPPPAPQNCLLPVSHEDQSAEAPDSCATAEAAIGSDITSPATQDNTSAGNISGQSVVVQQKPHAYNEHAYTVVSRKEKKRRHISASGAVRRKIRKKLKPGATRISSDQLQQLHNQLASSNTSPPVGNTTACGQYRLVQQNSVGVCIERNPLLGIADQSATESSTFPGASGQSVLVKQNSSDEQSSSAGSSPTHMTSFNASQTMVVQQKSHVHNEHAYTVVSPREMKWQLDQAINTIEQQKKKLKLSQRKCRDLQKQVDSLRQKVSELQKH